MTKKTTYPLTATFSELYLGILDKFREVVPKSYFKIQSVQNKHLMTFQNLTNLFNLIKKEKKALLNLQTQSLHLILKEKNPKIMNPNQNNQRQKLSHKKVNNLTKTLKNIK